jgi:predicted enzyme related to lactoylglutathione lyase
MTKDRRFKNRVRRRARATGESYAVALARERETRPPPRSAESEDNQPLIREENTVETKPAVATRLRGIWLGATDIAESRRFYERIGAHFDSAESPDGVVHGTLGGIRLLFEPASWKQPRDSGPYLLFDVTDADALHQQLVAAGCEIVMPPKNEPWGRQFNVLDPDGHPIAFIGPIS